MSRKRKIEDVMEVEGSASPKKHCSNESNGVDGAEKSEKELFESALSLPSDVISSHLLTFVEFNDWITIASVCKKWRLAAQHSQLRNQLVYRNTVEYIPAALNVDTLVYCAWQIPLEDIYTLIKDTPSVTTLVLDQSDRNFGDFTNGPSFEHITTLSTHDMKFLNRFPNVTRLKFSRYESGFKDIPETSLPPVKELEINIDMRARWNDFAYFKQKFPSLQKIYLNFDGPAKEDTWKTFEDSGKKNGLQIICRNPHLDLSSFSLTSVSYFEYFNGCGSTPTQNLIESKKLPLALELFTKYSNRKYEKQLTSRNPRFTFPSRSLQFSAHAKKTQLNQLSANTILELVKCGYISCWRALKFSSLMETEKMATDVFRAGKSHMLQSRKTAKAILKVYNKYGITAESLGEMIGPEIFGQIAKAKNREGDTFLHLYARSARFDNDDFDAFFPHCDINAVNNKKFNAATLLFNQLRYDSWLSLVRNGVKIQSEKYTSQGLVGFLVFLVKTDEAAPVDLLAQFNAKAIQVLLRKLSGKLAVVCGKSQRKVAIFNELVRLGANPKPKNDPNSIFRQIVRGNQVSDLWEIVEQYGFNVHEADPDGLTPLMVSINMNHYDQTKFLLAKGCDPNYRGRDQNGKMTAVAFLNNILTTRADRPFFPLLLQYKTDLAIQDEGGNTTVNRAVSRQSVIDVALLSGHVSLDMPNKDGYTPLAQTVMQRDRYYVRKLLAAGADVNVVSGPLQQSPFLLALRSCDNVIAFALLDKNNVDITVRDKAGRSFLYYLLQWDMSSIATILRTVDFSESHYNTPENISFIKSEVAALLKSEHLMARAKIMKLALLDEEIIEFIVKVLDFDVNTEDANGDTMLTTIDKDTSGAVVDFLLTNGANVNHQNKELNTALMLLVERTAPREQAGLKAKLIAAGASLTLANNWGIAPVDLDPTLKTLSAVSN